MRLLVLLGALVTSGCGLSYEITWPFGATYRAPHVARGEPLQRALYTDACEYPFGLRLTDTADPCVADLGVESRTVWTLEPVAFFGTGRAWLYVNSWDEMNAFAVVPDTPDQFDGIVEHYTEQLGTEPHLEVRDVEDCGPEYEVWPGDVQERTAVWEDARTRLTVTEDGCTGSVTLLFADIYARP